MCLAVLSFSWDDPSIDWVFFFFSLDSLLDFNLDFLGFGQYKKYLLH